MKKIGITGQSGFIGTHLYNNVKLFPQEFELVPFKKEYFKEPEKLDFFVEQCDVIVHLAAMNRHKDPEVLYKTNLELTQNLISSLERTGVAPHVLISSSSQEERGNLYGKSKKDSRERLVQWAKNTGATFTGMVIPNVYGPFGNPFYNSVVATFSHQIAHNETPEIEVDGDLKLIYISELVGEVVQKIKESKTEHICHIPHTAEAKVSELLHLLKNFKEVYQDNGEIPSFKNSFELNLFNTYRCYMNIKEHFPVKFEQHTDDRGSFVEIVRLGIGGQVSFSTTVPGITRGNHYHTRKVERFAVIKGKALIRLRRIGTDEILDFELNGDEPAYVDMPIWYTHNIENIGDEILYTNFWINEPYNSEDADTFFEEV
ncbi:polysaccharide biosynthesis C-terminal domain-containing protein [Salinimicrobium sp. HB62]|uniref:polysaccharide biosynthesis C-terminal domain-containing protein n=1 Tax=Salinimicrobium sp. HB62 TaxID=3077781 RepID=UPI002D784BD7|nr:NAD-dependent epimerase/dehydratase family protein [Salinimicrobium sp. HB62]